MSHRSILAVVFWMTGALLSFSTTAVAVRALSGTFSVFEILSIRNGTAVVFLLLLAAFRPVLRPGLMSGRIGLHLVRNVVHFAGTAAWAFSLTILPLATVFALEFTTPAWVALLAIPFLRERLTQGRLVAVILGFVGVLVILRPGAETAQPASLLVLGVALAFALVAIVTKRLTATESTFSIIFLMNLMQLPMNLIGAGWGFWQRLEVSQALPLLGLCAGGLLSHFCLTNAYRHGDASMVVPLDFLRIPLIAFVGWRLYGEPLDPYVFVGSACIIAGILYSLRRETKLS
ncbi:DMT family transporter [Microvirga sp. 17 mud 1-3]|uniref:DMT family transporter n=1 Tax=Microvirga sp. 17 mud 1-3 TaxID=2082949 RepID=UPI000D6BEFEB|nr:DMT family transporter [Microvirga sp. 17 mud 1-3]AWM85938.1 EamA/RhaT family transporter [Microvirga sp. 17 mud 1-3]